MTAQDFLPTGYELPTNKGKFMKLQKGENKFRILDKALTGWLDWEWNKPVRTVTKQEPLWNIWEDWKVRLPKHFRALKVWDYADNSIKILEVTQKDIQNAIIAANETEEFGNPRGYDIKVTKTGEKLETKYTVVTLPPKALSKDIEKANNETPVNLEALFDGWDPFSTEDVF